RGYDLAYDWKGKAFWLVGQELLKVTTDGKVLLQKPLAEWCAVSVAVEHKTGTVWVVARQYALGGGRNERLGFDNDGKALHTIPLGTRNPFKVAVDERDGAVWVANKRKSVLRYTADGKLAREDNVPALAVEADRSTGNAWVVTPEEILTMSRE